ncbi:hypothetical protein L1987_46121 [Smallanthus sonchifolius]|uniref:Uncharacterized protein n=1 Tax=Smallanthus sonchifolius TaxID=185202 RepID=A0ACB9FYX6_9ASTR|nr:hypothetical protein L1987_46121 [Smallanthus sonchifolius]
MFHSSSGDNDNNDNHDEGNVEYNADEDAHVEFDHEELNTTQGTTYPPPTPIEERVPTPIHSSPPAYSEEMPSWGITLQTQNQALQQAVEGLTTLVISLSTTVKNQDKEILKLKQNNRKLKVFSSSSSSDDARRQGEKDSEDEIHVADPKVNDEIPGDDHVADVHPSSPGVVNSPIGFPIRKSEQPSKFNLSKEIEEELSMKAIEDMLAQDLSKSVNAQIQLEESGRKVILRFLLILKKRLKCLIKLKNHLSMFKNMLLLMRLLRLLRRLRWLIKITEVPKFTPRKKSIPKRVIKRHDEVIIPDREKYKILFENIDTSDLVVRDIEKMVYLAKHGYKWEEILRCL